MSNLPDRYMGHAEIDLMARHAKAFSISGLFDDVKGEVQAYCKIIAGAEMGLLPFEAMGAFDVIKGKIVANSGFLASKVKGHPKYDFRVIEISNDRCEILFREKVDLPDGSWEWEDLGSSVFTMEDAKQAGLLGRGENYSKWSRNMLQSRAMSNGVRWFCPDVLSTSVYEMGEIAPPEKRPEQIGGPTATVPEREPDSREVIVDAELVNDAQTPREDDGTPTPEEAERAIALAIEQEELRREAAEARQMADDLHAKREAEVAAREQAPPDERHDPGTADADDPPDDDLPFGNDSPLPPPLSDAQKIDAIGDMFRPASGVALPAAERAKVKKACQALGIWGEQTPRELFRLFGDDAMTLATLKDALAAALEALPKESPAPAAAEPQEPVHAPPSAAEMLRKQEARVAEVVAVLGALSQDQAAVVYAAVPEGLQTPTDIARDLWLSYGLAALGADSLVDAVKAGS